MESYDKLREIGKGSYGVVWLVKNKKDKKNYVLKRIDLRKTSERDKLSAQQEAQLLKSLKHPNIVSYKESFQADGYLHIVMLYCDGGDLYTKIKEQSGKYLEETQIVEWFVQIAMALQYMHEKNILHRDLKTQNIFLTKNKIIKVGDLGIARVLKGNNDMATTIIGTPYYMSPELFSNKPYNSKSDVWALGCCVYEMTTLKHAFNAKDMTSLVFKITRGKMPSIPTHYSKELIALIESMLNSDPKKRPTVNKILRDSYIKKNIMLFLERTKQKQQLIEKENKQKDAFILNKESEKIVSDPINSNKSSNPVPIPRQTPSQSLNNNNNNDKIVENQEESNRKLQINKSGPRVRISSVVENIETREVFSINQSSFRSESENDLNRYDDNEFEEEEEQNEPYQLTKPFHGNKNFIDDDLDDKPVKQASNLSSHASSDNTNNNKPNQIFSIVTPQIKHSIITKQHNSDDNNKKSTELHRPESVDSAAASAAAKILSKENQAVLGARERRRQRLRLSQNDSTNPNAKPPVLRRYQIAHQSDNFFSNPRDQSKISQLPLNMQKQNDKQNYPLQDSLKIIKNSQQHQNQDQQVHQILPLGSAGISKNDHENRHAGSKPNVLSLANQLEKNPFFSSNSNRKKLQTEANSQSSSSSSVASSSNDENDPGKALIRMEKKQIKEKKEMENFISKLNSTLNAANFSKNESEVEDIKDEVLEDLEEEAIQIENENQQKQINSNNNKVFRVRNKPKRTPFFINNKNYNEDESDDNEYENENFEENDHMDENEKTIMSNSMKKATANINPLGATNHMHNRINSLENEFIKMIGKKKLDDAFKILDSFKEDEIEPKLIALMGKQLYDANSGKLWLLKFCKDTAKISMRN